MKKVMLIMMAILGMAWNVNAQVCEIAGNVEGNIIDEGLKYLKIKLFNHNDFMVNVTVELVFVNNSGETVDERTITGIVIAPKDKYEKNVFSAKGYNLSEDYSYIKNIYVTKCASE